MAETQEDTVIKKFEAERRAIGIRIQFRKAEVGREKGQSVQFVKNLKCEKHPEAKFKKTGDIPGGRFGLFGTTRTRRLGLYACKQCLRENARENKAFKSVAYQCPVCGYVYGTYETKEYRSSEESWRALAGKEGHHYHCKICGDQVGHHYWGYS